MKELITNFFQSRRIRFFAALIAANLLIFVVFRMAFLAYFLGEERDIPTATLLTSLYIGTKFDLRLAILLALPVMVLALLPRIHLLNSRITLTIGKVYLALSMAFVLLTYFVDFGHYAYLHKRLNASIHRFFEDAAISANMVWESYPVPWILLGFLALVILYHLMVVRLMRRMLEKPERPVLRRQKLIGGLVVFFLLSFGMFGKLSWYPLRWGDAFFVDQPLVNALGLNPTLFYFDTMTTQKRIYDAEKARVQFPVAARYLGVDRDNEPLNYSRSFPGTDGPRPNIIYVILESFGANHYGLFGNPLNSTPNLDEIGRNGLVFNHFYVPTGGGTARSVFTAMTGIPDVYPYNTSSNNPDTVSHKLILGEFEGYDKYYFLGGSASWRNIRALLKRNVPDLHLYEEGSYSEPRVDTWGISDLSLFREVVKVLGQRDSDKPFIAVIQTAGNHKPYTIPDDNAGFQIIKLPEDKDKRYGYRSQGRYNAVRFMDHSVGEFMKMVKKQDYFSDTIFAFHGDHGIYSLPSPHMPEYYDRLGLGNFNVPFILYAPSILGEPRKITQATSEVDVFPILAGLAGIPYTNTTLGRDVLHASPEMPRYAFLATATPTTAMRALIDEDYLYRTTRNGNEQKRFLYDLHSDQPGENVLDQHPEIAEERDILSHALLDTSRYMLYHN